MSHSALVNLAKIGQLKAEPASALDIERLLAMAHRHLDDAKRESNSIEGRFISAYSEGMLRVWPLCAGMVTAVKTGTWCFKRSSTQWVGRQCNGGSSTVPTISAM